MTAIDHRAAQRRLGSLYKGAIDGLPGPLFWSALVGYSAPTAAPDGDAVQLRGRKLAEVATAFDLTTAERVAGLLSNTSHETGDFHRLRENLTYTTAARIRATWPSRFRTDADAAPYVRQPEALANLVYARAKEGNTQPGDGWRFRGGGDIEITFRNGYRRAGATLNLPLEGHPELIETPAVALLTALAYWRDNRLNRFFDAGQPKRARALINCGNPDATNPIGWPDVDQRYERLLTMLRA